MGQSEYSDESTAQETAAGAAAEASSTVPAQPTVEESVRQLILKSGASLAAEDVDRLAATLLEAPAFKNQVKHEKLIAAGEKFQAAVQGPTSWLEGEMKKLYDEFNGKTADAMKTYRDDCAAAGEVIPDDITSLDCAPV